MSKKFIDIIKVKSDFIKEITEEEIVRNGIDWVRSFNKFKVKSYDIVSYPSVLEHIKNDYNVSLEYSDDVFCTSTWVKKEHEQVTKEFIEDKIYSFCAQYGITFENYKIDDVEKLNHQYRRYHIK